MESVLSLFGASINDMMKMLAEITKRIGTVVGRINEARQAAVNWLAEQMGNAMGVDTSFERQHATEQAKKFTQGFEQLDTKAMADQWAKAFDKTELAEKLAALNEQAQAEADAASTSTTQLDLDFDSLLSGLEKTIVGGMDRAGNVASVGTFNAQQATMMGLASEDYQLRTAIATERMNRQMDELNRKKQVVT